MDVAKVKVRKRQPSARRMDAKRVILTGQNSTVDQLKLISDLHLDLNLDL